MYIIRSWIIIFRIEYSHAPILIWINAHICICVYRIAADVHVPLDM